MLDEKENLEIQQLKTLIEKEYSNKLRMNRSHIYAINLINNLHSKIDSLVVDVKRNGKKFGCENNCYYCCSLRVEVLAPEVFYIAKQLKNKLTSKDILTLIKSLQSFSKKVKGLKMEDHNIACPMLSEGRCTIYNFRPFMCRKYNSLNAKACEERNAEIPEDIEIVAKSSAIGFGFESSITKRKLSTGPHEFGQALLVALTDKSAENNWSKGKQVFELIPEMKNK